MPITKLNKKQIKELNLLENTTVKTSNYSAVDKDRVLVDSSGGPVTVTLPIGVEGMIVAVQDIIGTAGTNNITVAGTINGVVDYVIAANFGNIELLFSDGDWIILSKEPSGGGGGGGHVIEYYGVDAAQEPNLDFRGAGVDIIEEEGRTAVVINDKHVISQTQQNILSDYTIQPGYNGLSVGPIIIDPFVTVTISPGSTWAIL